MPKPPGCKCSSSVASALPSCASVSQDALIRRPQRCSQGRLFAGELNTAAALAALPACLLLPSLFRLRVYSLTGLITRQVQTVPSFYLPSQFVSGPASSGQKKFLQSAYEERGRSLRLTVFIIFKPSKATNSQSRILLYLQSLHHSSPSLF